MKTSHDQKCILRALKTLAHDNGRVCEAPISLIADVAGLKDSAAVRAIRELFGSDLLHIPEPPADLGTPITFYLESDPESGA